MLASALLSIVLAAAPAEAAEYFSISVVDDATGAACR